jgi:septation ring formation regulator EzrA
MTKNDDLPKVFFLHKDRDMNDKELMSIMFRLEKDPENVDEIFKMIKKRMDKGDPLIAEEWVKYAMEIFRDDEPILDRLNELVESLGMDINVYKWW